jgi:cytosine permease
MTRNLTTAPGYRIALVMLGIAMTPVLLASAGLGSQLSLGEALAAIVAGSLILTVIGCMTCLIGVQSRMNTYQIVRFSFGRVGALAINALLAISMLGWICVIANGFGHALQDLLVQLGWSLPLWSLVACGGLLFIGATAFGFEVLSRVALYAIPVILLVLLYNLQHFLQVIPLSTASHSSGMNMGVAISTVVGTFMVLVATLPDFGAFAHNRRHALVGAILALAFAYPLLYLMAGLPSILSGRGTLAAAMALTASTLPALLLSLFATITGNAGNMFQGTLVTATLLPKVSKPWITVVLGILGCVIGSMDVMSWFMPFLLFLGVATPPIAGIYSADFVLKRRAGYDEQQLAHQPAIRWSTFAVWIVATVVGLLASRQRLTLTAIPSLDALLVAGFCYALLNRRAQAAPSHAHTSQP